MFFVLIATCMKLSLAHRYAPLAYACLAVAAVLLTTDLSSQQTRPSIEAFFAQRSLREYIAILITLEASLFTAYCFLHLSAHSLDKSVALRKRIIRQALQWYPGLLLLPILFYTQTSLFFSFSGVDFSLISYALATGVFIGIPLLSWLLSYLIPERELRLETLFILSGFIFTLGLASTIDDKISYAPAPQEFSLSSIAIAIGIFTICFIIGLNSWRLQRR